MTPTAPDPASSAAPDVLCSNPACGAANRAGTRFCATCGTAIAGAAPSMPPPAPIAPPQPPRFNGMGHGSIPTDRSVDVAMAAEWAHNHAVQALGAMHAEITASTPPSGLSAVILKKAIGNPLRFRCQISVQPTGPTSSRISFGVKVDWGSTMLMLGLIAAIGVFNLMFLTMSVGLWAPLFSACALGWAVYDYAIAVPNRIAGHLSGLLSGAPAAAPAPSQPQPAPASPAPAAAVTPIRPQPAVGATESAPAASDDGDIVTRIEKLSTLKDRGLISEAEFERRRADLLDRL